jgi:serine/threonine-protein kinase
VTTEEAEARPVTRVCPKCLKRFPERLTFCPDDGAALLTLDLGEVEDPRVGTLVDGRYLVLGRVADGGMAKIYRAWQRGTARLVALKLMHGHSPGSDVLTERFFREARVTAALKSPYVVTIHDAGIDEYGVPYMVMELLSGANLQTLLAEKQRLNARESRDLGHQLTLALSEAHAHGLVHRDLKPANIMVERATDGKNHIKLLDFGLVKLANTEEGQRLTRTGVILGTAAYMAPEQAADGGQVSSASDLYAVGVILYECLSGQLPFEGKSSLHTLLMHRDAPPPHLTERLGITPCTAAFERVILRCLAKTPQGRYHSAADLRDALSEIPVRETDLQISAAGTPKVLGTRDLRSLGSNTPTLHDNSPQMGPGKPKP